MKRGPKEVDSGTVYAFAHQAYWGFRFLAQKRQTLWKLLLAAETPEQVTKLGRAFSLPGFMAGAGYGAAGLMSWLQSRKVAEQFLAARNHRRYPDSDRPSSRDRRMINLGIGVASGVWEIKYSTALRKLAEAGLGIDHLAKEVHRMDHALEAMRAISFIWAEPVGNFFIRLGDKWEQFRELPCKVPANWYGGYILYGYGPVGPQAAFSRTLPLELLEPLPSPNPAEKEQPTSNLPEDEPIK